MAFLPIITLILIGYLFGHINENTHLEKLRKEELELKDIHILSLRNSISNDKITDSRLVKGSVVISIDYYKRIISMIKLIFGGNINSYEILLERARREAIVRLKKDAKGFNHVINLRVETSSVFDSVNGNQGGIGSVEILAYGTAVKLRD